MQSPDGPRLNPGGACSRLPPGSWPLLNDEPARFGNEPARRRQRKRQRWAAQWGLGLWMILAGSAPGAEVLNNDDYNQWKKALGTNRATGPGDIEVPPGFKVELLRSAQPEEGSWVALALDSRGRVVVAREDRGLLRLTLPSDSTAGVRVETINTNLLECRGLLFAHGALYANANNSKGLFRLRDTDGDDRFEEVTLLRSTAGNVGHGRNQLALGPDGMIYSIHGDDVEYPPAGAGGAGASNSWLRHAAEDHLVTCAWDKVSFNSYARIPYGHLVRTDPDGRTWELVAGGLRNPYGVAFNEAGDLFTYDADMEWDVGLPWYHPTRVLHLVAGGDYGWRRGTGVLPVWVPDTLPSAADIGVGSPTAVQFGTRSHFPERWRSALFILDWAYGKIFAVHLQRAGPTYTGRVETFARGRPLNVTGIDFGSDGALYFTTGGRRTQSGLYRVRWVGPAAGAESESEVHAPSPGPRYDEILARLRNASLERVWAELGSGERWARYAARVALEERSTAEWQGRALTTTEPVAALGALLALARVGGSEAQPAVRRQLAGFEPKNLSADRQVEALRALAVSLARHGSPSSELVRQCLARWEPSYPGPDARVNQALCELLVYLGSTNVVRTTLPLVAGAASQNEKFHYLFLLRGVREGWTLADRRTYFEWLVRAGREFHGANTLPIALKFMRTEAEATLSSAERAALADVLAAPEKAAPGAIAPVTRRFVREWAMNDLLDLLPASRRNANPALGARLFQEAGCAQCHRCGNIGGTIGPDLTAVGQRFDRRALLESLIEPSRVVAELYRTTTVVTRAGEIVEGRLLSESGSVVTLGTNPLDPSGQSRAIATADIEFRRVSELSPMPAGLVNTMDRDEILALLTWLEAGGTAP